MRYMLLMIPGGYESASVDAMPDVEHVEEMTLFNQSMVDAGVLLAGEGLHPPSAGARIRFRGGKPQVTDGPFAESKEALGGYWIIEVATREAAIEWAKKCPARDEEMIEVRQIFDMDELPEEVQAAAKP